jgi:hypothetical protein
MTPAPRPPINDRHKRIYDTHGRVIASVPPSRAEWQGALLAECERGHVYVLPADARRWMVVEADCPRCRVLGHG